MELDLDDACKHKQKSVIICCHYYICTNHNYDKVFDKLY